MELQTFFFSYKQSEGVGSHTLGIEPQKNMLTPAPTLQKD